MPKYWWNYDQNANIDITKAPRYIVKNLYTLTRLECALNSAL